LTKSQAERLKAVQLKAINITFCYSHSTPYILTLALAGIASLLARRLDHSKRFTETSENATVVYTTFFHRLENKP